jgi:hypothetical protein
VVNLIDDWDVLAEYVGRELGYYQRLGNDGPVEIRVQSGGIGFKKEFKTRDDSELLKILDFCKHRFIELSEKIRDEEFFK